MIDNIVTYELRNDIALIGLNRADKRNAMNGELFAAVAEAADRAQSEAKAAVIFGHGENFSAGLDLKYALTELMQQDPLLRYARREKAPFDIISRGRIPFVAALQGAVVGAGLELAAAAHIRIADETAFFALPEGQRGIFVGGGGSVRIQRLIGYGNMADMMLMGRVFDVRDAQRIGAVQYVTEPGENLLDRAFAAAGRMAKNAPRSNWAVVNALPRIADLPDDEGLFLESITAQFVAQSQHSVDGITEFLDKRASSLK